MAMDAWKVRCTSCGWMNWNADRGAVQRSGEIHAEILCPGHVVSPVEHLPGGWIR